MKITEDVLSLLCEKDALIAELKQIIAKKTEVIEDLQLGWSEDQERVRKLLDEKDAEIERLTINMNAYGLTAKNLANDFADYQADVKMDIAAARAEAITEFAERVKLEFYREFDEIIPSIMADKIDQIAQEMKGETDER